jgi:hypothetical protein
MIYSPASLQADEARSKATWAAEARLAKAHQPVVRLVRERREKLKREAALLKELQEEEERAEARRRAALSTNWGEWGRP